MRCPRCGTESFGPFCPACGEMFASAPPTAACPRCGAMHNLAACPNCGAPSPLLSYNGQPTASLSGINDVFSVVWNISMISVLILLLVNVAVLVYTSVTMILPELTAGSLQEWPVFTIFPDVYVLFFVVGTVPVTVYFLAIFAAIVYVYIQLGLTDGGGFIRLSGSPLSKLLPRLRSKNRWTMVAQLFLALSFFQVSYTLLLNFLGVQTNAPAGLEDIPWFAFFQLANASVFEELVSRVALIGLPMFMGSLAMRWLNLGRINAGGADSSKTRGRYILGSFRYLIGGNVERHSPKSVLIPALVLVVFSSIMFGAAHQGWGAWKLLPAFVAGLALGYAFLRGGLAAAILLHFATDYLSGTALLAGGNMALAVFLVFFLYLLFALGAGFFIYYCIYAYNVVKETLMKPVPATPPAHAAVAYGTLPGQFGPPASSGQAYQYRQPAQPFGTSCPYCGWPESVYAEGKLRCVNCGKVR